MTTRRRATAQRFSSTIEYTASHLAGYPAKRVEPKPIKPWTISCPSAHFVTLFFSGKPRHFGGISRYQPAVYLRRRWSGMLRSLGSSLCPVTIQLPLKTSAESPLLPARLPPSASRLWSGVFRFQFLYHPLPQLRLINSNCQLSAAIDGIFRLLIKFQRRFGD